MDSIVYITLEQTKETHRKTIQYSGGGTLEHFDLDRLESVLQNIQNDDYYPTFIDKITHIACAVALNTRNGVAIINPFEV